MHILQYLESEVNVMIKLLVLGTQDWIRIPAREEKFSLQFFPHGSYTPVTYTSLIININNASEIKKVMTE